MTVAIRGGKTQSIIKKTKHLNYVVFSLTDRVYFLLQIIRIIHNTYTYTVYSLLYGSFLSSVYSIDTLYLVFLY